VRERKRRKVGHGDLFFFPPQFRGRGWRCYRQLDEEQGLMGRQGPVARTQPLRTGSAAEATACHARGEKLQMNRRLYTPN